MERFSILRVLLGMSAAVFKANSEAFGALDFMNLLDQAIYGDEIVGCIMHAIDGEDDCASSECLEKEIQGMIRGLAEQIEICIEVEFAIKYLFSIC